MRRLLLALLSIVALHTAAAQAPQDLDAIWESVRLRTVRGLIEVQAAIKGRVDPVPLLEKDRLILLITALGEGTLQGEFHLKSNFALDFRTRDGKLALTKGR